MLAFSTRLHGILDYLVAAAALASPWLFGFADDGMAKAAAVGAGALVVVYSLLTDYEMGIARALAIPLHLWLDGLLGLLLAISPWLLGFDQQVWIPHVVIGAVLVLLAIFSHTIPGYERRGARA
jgi:hypothetical protein